MGSYLDKYELIQIHIEQFKRKDFSFIHTTERGINLKQKLALEKLTDKETSKVDYGGGAGGAKSWTGGCWQVFTRLVFEDTKGGIGRDEIKELRQTTLQTINKICKNYGAKPEHLYHFNSQDNVLEFENGSKIYLIPLAFEPVKDPEYNKLGSYELTDGWIEEAAGCNVNGVDVFATRLGRWNNDKYNLPRKLFRTFNPQKNWVYHQIYLPFKQNNLPSNHIFIPALVGDNPHIEADYINTLNEIADGPRKQRLLYGNFEYDEDKNALIPFDKITDCFTNTFVSSGSKYISIDVARFGKDSSAICVWDGLRCIVYQYYGKSITEMAAVVKAFQLQFNVPNSQTIADDDGVGGGLVDILKCKPFINNSTPLPNPEQPYNDLGDKVKENFANLKSQCYFKLADMINASKVYIQTDDITFKEKIIQELEQVKQVDGDGKKAIIPKDKVKEAIGRSPDFSDALMMRMWFEFEVKYVYGDAEY